MLDLIDSGEGVGVAEADFWRRGSIDTLSLRFVCVHKANMFNKYINKITPLP